MKRGCQLLFTAAALALEVFTKAAVGIYGPAPGKHIRVMYSYFSPVPFGYGMFPPLITGVLTVVLLILGLAALKKQKALTALCILGPVTFIVSLMPLLYGKTGSYWYYSPLGACISLCLLLSAIFAIAAAVRRKPSPGSNGQPPASPAGMQPRPTDKKQ